MGALGRCKVLVTRDFFEDRQTDGFRKATDPLVLVGHAALIVKNAGHAAAPVAVKVADAAQNVVSRVDCHKLAACDEQDAVRVLAPHGHGKTAAHHVSEHVVEDHVAVLFYFLLFKEVKRRDDAASRAAYAGLWPAGFYTEDAVGAGLDEGIKGLISGNIGRDIRPSGRDSCRLRRVSVSQACGVLCPAASDIVEHSHLRLAVHEQPRRVMLGVAAHLQNTLPRLRDRRR